MSAFRAALRIARRDALRFRGRTALIMVMIGLPVLATTALLTLSVTTDVIGSERLPSLLGETADARVVTQEYRTPVDQDGYGDGGTQDPGPRPARPWTAAEIGALVGGRVVPHDTGTVEVQLPDGYDRVDALGLDLRDPMTRGVRTLAEGRFPAAADEVAITPALLDRGMRPGTVVNVTRQARPMRVVGVYEHPNRPGIQEITGLPGTVLPDRRDGQGTGWLADTTGPVLGKEFERLNAAGLTVTSRAVIERFRDDRSMWPTDRRGLIAMAIGAVLVTTETVLLAGPAFAVGLRRRRRELTLVAVQGGSGAHLRMIVLAEGLVLGVAAAVAGTALGIGSGLLAESVMARELDWQTGPPEVPWGPVLAVAALGVASGLVAALVPATQAARQRPALVLADRVPTGRRSTGRPLPGLLLLALGLGAVVTTLHRRELAVVAASTVLLFGLVALTPWLVAVTGRLAARLPLPLRLSVRDASRHRMRTASAVAAVMAATTGAIVVGIGANSSFVANEAMRVLEGPLGSTAIVARGADDRSWARIRDVVEKRLPGVPLVPSMEASDERGAPVIMRVFPKREACRDGCPILNPDYSLPVGDERLLALLQRRSDPSAVAALRAGKAVAFDGGLVRDGMLDVMVVDWRQDGTGGSARRFRVPAVVSPGADLRLGGAVLPASA
ncbi:MAG: hypothetical protein K0R62_6931, partial [Nonomuraea muscovyensis]|nr:hypothetical protein [Nonomuraea muscovyensis]